MATKLHVGNLSYGTTADTLRATFAADGRQVADVSMMTAMNGDPRGFAFVVMATEVDAQAAIAALDGRDLDGRAIKVAEARGRLRGRRAH